MRTPLRSPAYRKSAMKRACCVPWGPKRRMYIWEVVETSSVCWPICIDARQIGSASPPRRWLTRHATNGKHSGRSIADTSMALDQQIKDALDEARMVGLVVQVLLGFQFSVVWQRRFDQLPPYGRHLHVAGL